MNTEKPIKEKPFLIRVLSKKGVDFVILFLAITLGFFVDNYRDEYVGAQTAKEMAGDMIQDISADTVTVNAMLTNAYVKGAMLDSLYNLLSEENYTSNDSLLYVYSAYVNRRILFERHNSTYTLLISTGYLKYFCKTTGTAMNDYEVDCNSLRDLMIQERTLLNDKIYPFQQQIFNIDNFHAVMDKRSFTARPTLRNWTLDNCMLYRNYISELKLLNQYIITQYQVLLKSAVDTQDVLKVEYGS